MGEPSSDRAPTRLDLRGTPCPLNYVRSRLALEAIPNGDGLEVLLDSGEPEEMVTEGLRRDGHRVTLLPSAASNPDVRLLVIRDGGQP